MSDSSHPALQRFNNILVGQAYTAGTCEAGPHDLELYYRKAGETVARFIDFGNVTADQLRDLTRTCLPATFGRGNEDVLDESYRKAGKLDSDCFATRFDLPAHNILDSITTELMDHEKIKQYKLIAELYKLNVYDEGAFFKAHKDTPRGTNMIGSLVVVLPTEHQGGSLILRHNDGEWTFDSGKKLSDATNKSLITYVAFYSDVEHEVTPVTSGHRITLTYNLYSVPRTDLDSPSIASSEASLDLPLKAALEELLADSSFLPTGGRVAWAFAHQYPFRKTDSEPEYELPDSEPASDSVPYTFTWQGWEERLQQRHRQALLDSSALLKGSDARLYRVCQQLGLTARLMVAFELTSGWAYRGENLDRNDRNSTNVTVLFDRFLDVAGWSLDEDDDDMAEYLKRNQGGELVRMKPYKGKSPTFVWATKPNQLNCVGGAYTTYGNEASTDYLYGNICLVVTIEDLQGRK